MQDLRGIPVSSRNARSLERFEQALREFQSYFGDPVATLDAALAEDPDFVSGHLLRATVLGLSTERRFLPAMRESVEAAEARSAIANDRERALTRAVREWLDGDWPAAVREWEWVLIDHPRDALALQAAHLADFYLGDSTNLRDRVARVLPEWSTSTPGYSFVLGMYAFGLEETNLYDRAEEAGRRALAIEPRDAWSVHAVAHVMEMQGRYGDGARWYRERERDWAPENGLAYHNWWHLALFHLEAGEHAAALALYDERIRPKAGDLSLQMLDATALLWRLALQDADVGDRFARLADLWAGKADVENGFYAFNDCHAALAFAAAGRRDELRAVEMALEAATQKEGVNAMMSRDVGLPLLRAIRAFAHGDFTRAGRTLARLRPVAHRFGGSHAQRDLISQTLLVAGIRSGRRRIATHFANERLGWKPDSPLTRRYRERALALPE
jgi:tetratricopeptide (TPR) repeat protein